MYLRKHVVQTVIRRAVRGMGWEEQERGGWGAGRLGARCAGVWLLVPALSHDGSIGDISYPVGERGKIK